MIIFAALLLFNSHALAMDDLNQRQIAHLHQQVNEYFSPASPGNLTQLEGLRPRLEVIQIVLRTVRIRLAWDKNAVKFAGPLMDLLSRKAVPAGTPRGYLRRQLEVDLEWLLRNMQLGGQTEQAVLSLYDRWQLWGSKDLWYFLRIDDPDHLRPHASRLRVLLPHLSSEQLPQLAQALRKMRIKSIHKLVLLLETGHMLEQELVQLLSLTSMQFARAVDRRDLFDDDEAFQIHVLEDPVQRSISSSINHIMQKLRENDPMVGSAFDKAVELARKGHSRNYRDESRLLFFTLLQEGRLDWANRATWTKQVEGISKENIALKQRYRVEGSVILVQFRPKSQCEDDLDN